MRLNFRKVYFCTGARNHDLLGLLEGFDLAFEYDERMASFKALGLCKVSELPVAVCTTSGTAVAECIPALLEAKFSKLPLVLISGDRPKKLHHTGSPQTIDHEALTAGARGSYVEVDLSKLAELSLEGLAFPVHINVLVDDTTAHELDTAHTSDLSDFEEFLRGSRRPLFLFSHENFSMRPLIEEVRRLGVPFYAESLSGGRDLSSIRTEKKLVELFNRGEFDSVVRIGHTPLSKIWRLLEKKCLPAFHFDSRKLAALSYGKVSTYSSRDLHQSAAWWEMLRSRTWEPISDDTEGLLAELCARYPEAEVSLMRALHDRLPEQGFVYLGNSLVIRNFELVQRKNFIVHGNRGVNGIDGQLATAIGLAQGSKTPVTCILGDITTLYDLSSLREMPENLRLVILNNKGGRIFDLLRLDKRIVLEHGVEFGSICRGFNLTYGEELSDFGKVRVLELFPSIPQSEALLKDWQR